MTEHRFAQIVPSDTALLPGFGLKKVGHPAEGREPILTRTAGDALQVAALPSLTRTCAPRATHPPCFP